MHWFWFCLHRGLEELELIRYQFYTYNYDPFESSKSVLHMYREVFKYPSYKAVAFLLMWRLFSIVPLNIHIENYLDLIDNVIQEMTPFVKDIADKKYTQFIRELAIHSNCLRFVFVRSFCFKFLDIFFYFVQFNTSHQYFKTLATFWNL